jgi:catechol 2,3-dioxygenase-like lactoylglutathione lyase family enzyme
MIYGAHFLLYSSDPEADRAFLRDVLGFRSVDAGHGWLIFALPPAELAVHPAEGTFVQRHADHDLLGAVLYLMCDDVHAVVRDLRAKKVACSEIVVAEWGLSTTVPLPSGGRLGLYQPTHPTAIGQ